MCCVLLTIAEGMCLFICYYYFFFLMCNTQGKQIMRQIVVAQHKTKVDITLYTFVLVLNRKKIVCYV